MGGIAVLVRVAGAAASALAVPAAAAAPDAVDEAVAAFPARFEGAINDDTRAMAVAELGLLRDPRVAAALKPHLRHPSAAVRVAVARTIGEQRDPSVAPLLASLFEREQDRREREPAFLAALLEGIGEADARRNLRLLSRAAGKWLELDLEVCRAAARAVAQARDPEAVGELVDLLERADARRLDQKEGSDWEKAFESTVDSLSADLRRATGRDIKNVKDWRDWWRDNKKTWRPPSAMDEEKPKDPDLFTDPAGKFTVRRPSASWTWKESKDFTVRAQILSEGRFAADFAVRTATTAALAAQTATAMADEWRPRIEEDFKEVKAEGTRWGAKTRLSGVTAVMHEVHGLDRENRPCTVRWYFLVKDGVSYRVIGTCRAGRDEPARKEWDAFFASFRFEGR